jgi:hypothetical protein
VGLRDHRVVGAGQRGGGGAPADVVDTFEDDDPPDPGLPKDVPAESAQPGRAQAAARDRVAADALVQSCDRRGAARLQSPGEGVANQIGWVEVLRRWVDVARRTGNDVTAETVMRPGDPTNLALSQGLAFLLDLPDPGVV